MFKWLNPVWRKARALEKQIEHDPNIQAAVLDLEQNALLALLQWVVGAVARRGILIPRPVKSALWAMVSPATPQPFHQDSPDVDPA